MNLLTTKGHDCPRRGQDAGHIYHMTTQQWKCVDALGKDGGLAVLPLSRSKGPLHNI